MPEPWNRAFGTGSADDDALADDDLALSADDLLIEAFLDGELDEIEQRSFEARLLAEPDLAEELALARSVHEGLRELPSMACPDRVHRAVIDHAEANPSWGDRGRRWLHGLRSRLGTALLRPAIPTLAALGLAATVSWQLMDDASLRPHDPGLASDLDAGPRILRPALPTPQAPPEPALPAPRRPTTGEPTGDGASAAVGASAPDPRIAESRPAPGLRPHPGPGPHQNPGPDRDPGPSALAPSRPGVAGFSADEVARAEEDVKLALAYLGQLGRTADSSVRELTLGRWMEKATGKAPGTKDGALQP